MKVLGIETTCDETGAAVIDGAGNILSDAVYSQIALHKKFYGVVPELASRAHAQKVAGIVKEALQYKGVNRNKPVDAVAFAHGPGLPGALLIGKTAALTVAELYNVPIIGVNHLEGHIYACELNKDGAPTPLEYPLIALTVSGGHTELWYVKDVGNYTFLGATRDDAAGEAFDKVAKLLDLGYPGGPMVEKMAKEGKEGAVKFPRPYMKGTWEFSFSGLKTSVSYYLRDAREINKANICLEFQNAVIDTLVRKTVTAAMEYKVKTVAVGGGVSANSALREAMELACKRRRINARFVAKPFCTDNGVMIAYAGLKKIQKTGGKKNCIKTNPSLKIESWNA